MLKLLLIAKDTSEFLNRNYYFLEQQLSKLTQLMVWRKSGNIKSILETIPAKPDFILILNDIGSDFSPYVEGLADINIPCGLIVNDAHRLVDLRRRFIEENNIRNFFVICKNNFHRSYPDIKCDNVFYLPYFVNRAIYKDYNLPKRIDMLMLGAANPKIYPLRNQILKYYNDDPRFVTKRHPGFRNFTKDQEKNQLIGKNYAKKINEAKMFFTCGSILEVPTLKFFEIPACRTLLMAPTFKELEEIGFIPGTHFVDINEENFAEKAEYYLNNPSERKRITDMGYQFVRDNHSTFHRAKQLVQQISMVI